MGGFSKDNSYGDLIYTNEDTRINQERQYFWEAFPAMSLGEDARTTYLFTYLDADEMRQHSVCLLYTSPSPRDLSTSRMPSSA